MSAVSCLERVLDAPQLVTPSVHSLVKALIKMETTAPLKHSAVIPTAPLLHLFQKWPHNQDLPLQDLRLKAITLFALSAMLRPSDIAPRSGFPFTRKQVSLCPDGTAEIYFHGIKNDSDRDGFRVFLQRVADSQVCPVEALLCYMTRTALMAGGAQGPVFITLQKPFRPLCVTSVTNILNEALSHAGLSGYSAKHFRCTGATNTVTAGMTVDTVQALGRWKSAETFRKHYVHVHPDRAMTDAALGVRNSLE